MPILRKLASITHQSLIKQGASAYERQEQYNTLLEHLEYILRYDLGKSYPEHAFETNDTLYWRWQLLPERVNLVHSYPAWTIALMLIKAGKAESVMLIDAHGDEYLAAAGKGVHYGNQRVRIRQPSGSKLLYVSDVKLPGEARENGSTMLAICQMARGCLDAICFSQINDFEIVFAHTMLRQAGARCTDFSGKETTAADQLIAAENQLLRRLLIQLFNVKI